MRMTDRFGYQQPAESSPIRGSSLGAPVVTSPEDTRDRIINTYREEIKNHQARERDFKILQEVLADLQRRTRVLENEITGQQRDHEERVRDQQKTVSILQSDLDQTKRQIKDRQDEGINIHDQTQQVKRQIDDRNVEIARTSSDLDQTRNHNEVLRRDIDNLHAEIAYNHDVKKKQQNNIFIFKGDQRCKEKEVED